jgi:3-oxoacyl-[acyl-carrier protein] reductase
MSTQRRGRLAGKVAIVTGAASGVGAAATRLFLDEGALVVAGDYRGPALREAHGDHGTDVRLVEADVRDQAGCDRLIAAAADAFGGVDVLFNNAGATIRGTLEDTDDDLWRAAIDVNLRAVVRLCRGVVPHMRVRGSGSIVNNASITALRGVPGALAYAAAKGGVTAVTRALAIELAPEQVRVNAICPSVIDSPMTWDYVDMLPDPDAERRKLEAKHPLGRFANPLDVAHAALFLASDESSYITGVSLPVDGGRHIS